MKREGSHAARPGGHASDAQNLKPQGPTARPDTLAMPPGLNRPPAVGAGRGDGPGTASLYMDGAIAGPAHTHEARALMSAFNTPSWTSPASRRPPPRLRSRGSAEGVPNARSGRTLGWRQAAELRTELLRHLLHEDLCVGLDPGGRRPFPRRDAGSSGRSSARADSTLRHAAHITRAPRRPSPRDQMLRGLADLAESVHASGSARHF